ncbi:hypothetical protein KMW28_11840 [Flammeovirga yaeyamensis]|uniref:Uncharacterized protein n=1 Tax=Flammeovirga yaeyamensis TaxID=367791 RepID=A0AAX1MYF8_9BACT|nr:hypothetical protein [Flammeovirga yaeyamensis]MBB3696145.1 hypothetical protein [Flammeovirga yaeyamensis]NMF34829.1 hypothetical protein [Flammeovirga yaeyamensis]QWG00343.1 hypothetical protein KMW28_11840 [Flammeovirga yaeyamensis]
MILSTNNIITNRFGFVFLSLFSIVLLFSVFNNIDSFYEDYYLLIPFTLQIFLFYTFIFIPKTIYFDRDSITVYGLFKSKEIYYKQIEVKKVFIWLYKINVDSKSFYFIVNTKLITKAFYEKRKVISLLNEIINIK